MGLELHTQYREGLSADDKTKYDALVDALRSAVNGKGDFVGIDADKARSIAEEVAAEKLRLSIGPEDAKAGLRVNSEYLRCVVQDDEQGYRKLVDENKQFFSAAMRVLITTTSTMSYGMPVGFQDRIIELMQELVPIRALADIWPVAEKTGTVPVDSGTAPTAYRVLDGTAATESAPTLGQLAYSTYEMQALLYMSIKLIRTGGDFLVPFMQRKLARSMADLEWSEFATGDGTSGAWTGLTNSSFSSVSATTIYDHDTIRAVFYALGEYVRGNAVRWFMHRNVQAKLHGATDPSGRYIHDQNRPLTELFGIPIETNSNLTGTGATCPAILANVAYYVISQGYEWGLTYTDQGKDLVSKRLGLFTTVSDNDGQFATANAGKYCNIDLT